MMIGHSSQSSIRSAATLGFVLPARSYFQNPAIPPNNSHSALFQENLTEDPIEMDERRSTGLVRVSDSKGTPRSEVSAREHSLDIPSDVLNIITAFLGKRNTLASLLPVSRQILNVIVNDPNFKLEYLDANGAVITLGHKEFLSRQLLQLRTEKAEIEQQLLTLGSISLTWFRLLRLVVVIPLTAGLAATMVFRFPLHAPIDISVVTGLSGFLSTSAILTFTSCPAREEKIRIIRTHKTLTQNAKEIQKEENVHQEFLKMCEKIEAEFRFNSFNTEEHSK